MLLALACPGLALAPAQRPDRTAASSPPGGAQMFALALRFTAGERIIAHGDTVDRVNWILPAARLEAFRAQGLIIEEQTRTHVVADGTVTSVRNGAATLRSAVTTTVHDVPRDKTNTSHDTGTLIVTPANTQVGERRYAIEDAPMIGLPSAPVVLGSRWTTTVQVLTTLGSGHATFEHTVAAVDRSRVRVDISGAGTITGKEYNLPRLLPGTIRLTGSAWFDRASGLVTQESYHVENTLVKPAGSERIGFTEVLDADSDLHKEETAASRMDAAHAR